MYDTLVIIPTLNEAYTIRDVVDSLASLVGVSLLLVDDGSTDDTVRIADDCGVTWIANRYRAGRDGCIRTGLAVHRQYFAGEWVVVFDGDGQHPVSFVEFVRRQHPGKTFFKGNRFAPASPQVCTPLDRRMLATLLCRYVCSCVGPTIMDINCGLLAFPTKAIGWTLRTLRFDRHLSAELSLWLTSPRTDYRLREVPIPAIYTAEAPKHVSLYRHTSSQERFWARYDSLIDVIDQTLRLVYMENSDRGTGQSDDIGTPWKCRGHIVQNVGA